MQLKGGLRTDPSKVFMCFKIQVWFKSDSFLKEESKQAKNHFFSLAKKQHKNFPTVIY